MGNKPVSKSLSANGGSRTPIPFREPDPKSDDPTSHAAISSDSEQLAEPENIGIKEKSYKCGDSAREDRRKVADGPAETLYGVRKDLERYLGAGWAR